MKDEALKKEDEALKTEQEAGTEQTSEAGTGEAEKTEAAAGAGDCLLYTSPSPRD